jgi:hypothetical protein
MDKEDPDIYDDEPLSEDEICDIEISLREIERGEVYPLEDVIRELRRRDR